MAAFQAQNFQETPVNYYETEIAEQFTSILYQASSEFHDLEITQEESLDFEEPFKDIIPQIIMEDKLGDHLPDFYSPPTDACTTDDEHLTYEYKQKAVEYWRSGKKRNLSLDSVKQKFRKVNSITQLRRWAHTLNKGGTYREKMSKVCGVTLENFEAALDNGLIIHDKDIQKWAMQASQQFGSDFKFKASGHWLSRFKIAHRIVSRKINKFVSRKTLEGSEELEIKANTFLFAVRQSIAQVGIANIYNSDQSGFQLEMHSGRCLAIEGQKKVECVVQSVSSTTHSYTIQPLISAEGILLSPLYIVLKESSGHFGPIVERNLFRAQNVYVDSSKSGKLTTGMPHRLITIFYHNENLRTLKKFQITLKSGLRTYIYQT